MATVYVVVSEFTNQGFETHGVFTSLKLAELAMIGYAGQAGGELEYDKDTRELRDEKTGDRFYILRAEDYR